MILCCRQLTMCSSTKPRPVLACVSKDAQLTCSVRWCDPEQTTASHGRKARRDAQRVPAGIQTNVISWAGPVVAVAAQEHLLAVVWHAAAPFPNGSQCLHLSLLDAADHSQARPSCMLSHPSSMSQISPQINNRCDLCKLMNVGSGDDGAGPEGRSSSPGACASACLKLLTASGDVNIYADREGGGGGSPGWNKVPQAGPQLDHRHQTSQACC